MSKQKIYHDHYTLHTCNELGFYPHRTDTFPIVSVTPYEEAGKDKYKIVEIGYLEIEKFTTVFVIAKVNYNYYRRNFLEEKVKLIKSKTEYLVLCNGCLVLLDSCELLRDQE